MTSQEMGARLKQRRTEKQFSSDGLGAAVGVSGQQIGRYERGENAIAAAMLISLAAALECSPLYFLTDGETLREHGEAFCDPMLTRLIDAFVRNKNPKIHTSALALLEDHS